MTRVKTSAKVIAAVDTSIRLSTGATWRGFGLGLGLGLRVRVRVRVGLRVRVSQGQGQGKGQGQAQGPLTCSLWMSRSRPLVSRSFLAKRPRLHGQRR